jgi:DNA/RNA-binding domain of Phe-tRNA-synthetase-like protein
MQFCVTEDCRRLGLRAGAVVFRDIHVGARTPELDEAIRAEARNVQSRFDNVSAIRALSEVVAFRDILRQAGADPRRDQPSVERLLGYVMKRGDLPAVNALVDAYNLISIRSLCSLGAHDLDRIEMPVSLQMLQGNETFTPLGGEKPMSIGAGEFGYRDAAGRVLCRLDVVQADFSKVVNTTRNVLLIVEGTARHDAMHLRRTVEEVISSVTEHCGGTAEILAWPD